MSAPDLTFTGHLRAVLTLGLPLVGGHLAQFAIGLTDAVMIGWYGVPQLAALTLAHSLFFTLFLLGSGFAWAIMPLVASFAARGDETQIRRATRMALWWSGLFFAAVMPLLWLSGPALRALGQTDEIAGMAQHYLRIAGWGMLPALGVMTFKNYLGGLSHTRVVLWITVAGAVANAIANYALIFGHWGLPELGIAGAALASVASNAVMLALVIAYALRVLPEHTILVRFWKPDTEMFWRIFRLGLPIGLTILAEVALFAASAVLMGWLGTVPLAAHGIAMQITSATFMLQMGFSNAATVRAGTAHGLGDPLFLTRSAAASLTLGAVGVAFSIVLFLGFPDLLMGAFVDPADPARDEIIAVGRVLLAVAALFQLADAAQVIHIGLLRGLLDTRVPMIMAAVAYWGVGMPAAWIMGFPLGLGGVGVWLGLSAGLGCAAIGLAWRFWRRGAGRLAPVPVQD